MDFAPLEKKLKQYFLSDSDHNSSRFSTPSEIHRKTSTPRLISQKVSFEYQTPCASNFSLKTHESQSTAFLSFSPHYLNEETTPFKTDKEQFLRSNSGRKLDIMEERDKNYKTDKITANASPISSISDMDTTIPVSFNIVQFIPPESDVIRKESDKTPDIVKKVRFSDQHETLSEFESLAEEDVFLDVCEMSRTQNAKNIENLKDTKDTENIKNISENVKDTKDIKDQAKDEKCPEKHSNNSQIKVAHNMTNAQDENRNPEISTSSAANEQSSNGMMMIMLMENHSCRYNTDLVPIISSGLQKMQEQLTSMSYQLSSDTNKSLSAANLRRKSITKMEMRVSSVESNTMNSATTIVNHQEIISSSFNDENSSNGGFFSTVTQAMKNALRSFSS